MSNDINYPTILLYNLIGHFSSKKSYFIDFAKFRMNCEGWIKAEVLRFLSDLSDKNEIDYVQPEKSNGSKRCDIFFSINGQDYWMEIKTFPTNYCTYFTEYKSKPISNFRRECEKDLDKLEEYDGNPIFLLFAYPLPQLTLPLPDSVAIKRWWKHLQVLRESNFKNTIESSFPLSEDAEVGLYIFMKGIQTKMLVPSEECENIYSRFVDFDK